MLVFERHTRTRPLVQLQKLRGRLSVKLPAGNDFAYTCARLFSNFDPVRYEPVAIRVFHKRGYVITVYAIDRIRWERSGKSIYNLPVKKFKTIAQRLPFRLSELLELNFTLATEDYPLQSMRVINR